MDISGYYVNPFRNFVSCGFRLQCGGCGSRAQNLKFRAQHFDLHRSDPQRSRTPKILTPRSVESPKTLLEPPTYDTFPPPLCSRPVIFLIGNGYRPDESDFWGLQNWFWRGHSMVRFSPPKSHDTFCPTPPFANSQSFSRGGKP